MKRTKILAILVLRSELLRRVALVLALGLMVCQDKVSKAAPMGTAFTYQGRLMDANVPADGLYDFEFALYDDASAGNQQGSTVDVNDLDVIDGYFTVELDFGSGVFTGEARWLETATRLGDSNDVNDFVTLSPRQELTPTPYAISALSSDDANTLGGLHASAFASSTHSHNSLEASDGSPANAVYVGHLGNVGIGTTSPSAKLNVEGGGIVMGDEATEGTTNELKLYGYRTGDALRSLQIGVGVDAADTVSFDGVTNYLFDGYLLSDKLTVGSTTIATNTITVGNIDAPTGRCAPFVVAANDAPQIQKDQADYVCDANDDQVQIQAAINAAGSGGKVVLSEGTYSFSSQINVDDDIIIFGMGTSTMIESDGNARHLFYIQGKSNVTIRDLVLDATNGLDQGQTEMSLIYCGNSDNLLFDNLVFQNVGDSDHGLRVEGCDYVTVTKCTFNNCKYSLRLCESDYVIVTNNFFVDFQGLCLGLCCPRHYLAEGNTFYGDTWEAAIWIGNFYQDAYDLQIKNNFIKNKAGIHFIGNKESGYDISNIQIMGNTFETTGYGIYNSDAAGENDAVMTNVLIKDNVIKEATKGIYLQDTGGTDDYDFVENTFLDCTTDYDIGSGINANYITYKDGNVGIGTTTPGAKLDVNGYIQTQDNLPFSIRRYTGTLGGIGTVKFDHGITNGHHKGLIVQAWCKGNTNEMMPMDVLYMDGGQIRIIGGIANRPYRVTIIYTSSDHVW